MKLVPAHIAAFILNKTARRNFRLLLRYIGLLALLVTVYSILFHVLMEAEGQEHSWLTGFYWTLTVMSTLGFGDITFTSDIGRAFSIVVLLSGVLFLLVVFPFTFIHFFYQPWLEAQDRARAPRELPPETQGHVILTGNDPVVLAIVTRLRTLGRPYVVLVAELKRALELAEEGIKVMVGSPDDGRSWKRARVERASTVVAAHDDYLNTNIVFTVREHAESVQVIALARARESVDVLQLAGANHVVQLADLLGISLARRAYGGHTRANVVGTLDGLLVAEAPMTHSCLVGKTLGDARIAASTGTAVVGTWEEGAFSLPHHDTVIREGTVLVLAGGSENLAAFDRKAGGTAPDTAPILILGGGRVGRVVARELTARGLDYRIVDLNPERATKCDKSRLIVGSAADYDVLERAGLRDTPTVVVTTHDDATNVYLTLYCHKLRPDAQIVARSNLDRNVSTLHRAGANLVMSYVSLGASTVLGLTDARSALHVAEGLELFRTAIPSTFEPVSLAACRFRENTGCTIVSIQRGHERMLAPSAATSLEPGDRLIVAGPPDARRELLKRLEGPAAKRAGVPRGAASFE